VRRWKSAMLFAGAIFMLAALMIPRFNRRVMAKSFEPASTIVWRRVEKVDVETGEMIVLTIPDWKKLGDKAGRYKNPRTRTYTMIPVISCQTCGEKMPGCMPGPSLPEKERQLAQYNYRCPKCGHPSLDVPTLSAEERT